MNRNSSQQNRISTEMVLNTWATFIYFLAQWLLVVLVTRLRGYEDAGILTLSISFSNIFGMLSRFGVRGYQVGDVEREYPDGAYFTFRIICCCLSAVLFGVCLWFSGYRADLAYSCIAMMLFKFLESFDDVVMGTMQRYRWYGSIAVSYTLKGIVTALTFLAGLAWGVPLPGCIVLMSAGYLLVLLTYDGAKLKKTAFFVLTTAGLWNLILQCIPLVVSSILDTVLVFIPRNAVEKSCGSALLGFYGTISVIVVIASTLVSAIWGSLLPEISQCYHEKAEKKLTAIVFTIAVIIVPGSIIAFLCGIKICPVFFRLLYGQQIMLHMEILPFVLCNAILLMLNSFFLCIFIPLKKQAFMTASNAVAVIVCAGSSSALLARFQLSGACMCLGLGLLVRFLIQLTGGILYTHEAMSSTEH